MARQVNQAGLDLVKSFEGFSDRAYLCPAGVWTIGYGHTKDVKKGMRITRDEAEQLLADDLKGAAADVEKLIKVELGDNQFAALVSFTFNVGSGNLAGSTLRKLLNVGDYDAVPAQMMRWNKAKQGGKLVEMAGLTRRRVAEGALWLQDAAPLPKRSMPQMVGMSVDDFTDHLNQGA